MEFLRGIERHSLKMIYIQLDRVERILWLLATLWIIQISAEDDEIVEVDIESGRIRGKQNVTLYKEMAYYSFRGIPYAQPPINEHRFRVSITQFV